MINICKTSDQVEKRIKLGRHRPSDTMRLLRIARTALAHWDALSDRIPEPDKDAERAELKIELGKFSTVGV